MLNYHTIWLRYSIWIEATLRFVMCKLYTCVIDRSIFIKTTKAAYQLKSNEVTVASINLADELVILLIFVNYKHFANTVTVGKVSHADKMRMHADAAWAGIRSYTVSKLTRFLRYSVELSSYVPRPENIRPRGHDRLLPACTSILHKQSFVIRSSFGILYLIAFCLNC